MTPSRSVFEKVGELWVAKIIILALVNSFLGSSNATVHFIYAFWAIVFLYALVAGLLLVAKIKADTFDRHLFKLTGFFLSTLFIVVEQLDKANVITTSIFFVLQTIFGIWFVIECVKKFKMPLLLNISFVVAVWIVSCALFVTFIKNDS
jgi:hypothetical protein